MKEMNNLLKNKIVKNASWLIGGKLAHKLLAFLVGLFTARYLGPSNYGLINYGAAYTAFFASICTLGINSIIVKDFVDHPDEEGKFNEATYESLVQLAAYLLNTYDLGEDALLRHYEVTGKICPRYYVDHPEAWETLKDDIMKEVEAHPNSVLVME